MPPPPNAFADFRALFDKLSKLSRTLPTSIPLAPKDSRIVEVFNKFPVPTNPLEQWETFNRRFDILFGEYLRNKETGRLPNIERGKHGLDLVLSYIGTVIDKSTIDWTAAMPKLQRLFDEVQAVKAAAPGKAKTTAASKKGKGKATIAGSDDEDENDKDYTAPRRDPRDSDGSDDEYPDDLRDEDGEEIVLDTEERRNLLKKRALKKSSVASVSQPVDEPAPTKSSNLSAAKKRDVATFLDDAESGDESGAPVDTSPTDADTEKYNLGVVKDIMAEFLKEGELNPAFRLTKKGFLKIFALWILDEDLPWTTGEAPLLRDLFKYLGVTHQLPTDTTIRNELAYIFADLHGKVVREFANVKSRISYSTDTWTTRQMTFTFACTIAQFIDDDWNLVERVIDFKALEEKEHEGYYGARAFLKGARGIGGLNKFMAMATDNASTNDEIFRNVARYLVSLYDIPNHPDRHIRCLAHVINLVVQAILASLKEADACEEPVDGSNDDDNDYYLRNKDGPIHYDVFQDPVQEELEAQRDDDLKTQFVDVDEFEDERAELGGLDFEEELEEELKQLGLTSALKKLRFIVTKIASSPQRRQRFWKFSEEAYGETKMDPDDNNSPLLRLLMVVRDVRTRWNSTHAMIARALLLKKAIDEWVIRTGELRHLVLSRDEWKELELLGTILSPFTEITKQISSSSYPTIPFALPIYFQTHGHLSSICKDMSLPQRIRSAVSQGLAKLNKYKSKAEQNHYLKIGTVLHPSMRAEWFRKTAPFSIVPSTYRKEQDKAVADVKIIFRKAAQGYQEEIDAEKEASGDTTDAEESTTAAPLQRSQSASSFLSDFCAVPDITPHEEPPLSPDEELDDELRRYYDFEGGSGKLFEPLVWWKTNAHRFPIISRMARDFLAIPATSVSVERSFSKSRRLCTELRSSLRASTVTQSLLTKLWIRSKHFRLVDPPERPQKRRKTTHEP